MELSHGPGLTTAGITYLTEAVRDVVVTMLAHAGTPGWATWAPLKLPLRWRRGRCYASSLPNRNSIGTVCQWGSEWHFICKEANFDEGRLEAR